jgi:hypothetical protein
LTSEDQALHDFLVGDLARRDAQFLRCSAIMSSTSLGMASRLPAW